MAERKSEWFHTFEDIFKNDYFYIVNIGYFDYRLRVPKEGKAPHFFGNTLHFVVGGRGTMIVDGREYSIGRNSVFSLPSGKPVILYPDEEDPWRYYWFNVGGSYVSEIRREMGFPRDSLTFPCDFVPKIAEKIDELFDTEFNYGEFYYRAMSTLFYIISLFVEEHPPQAIKTQNIVGQAKEIILSNFAKEDFSVSVLPQMLHVSPTWLRRLFRESVGQTPANYLIVCRLNAAADYLTKRPCTIKELCYLVGYRDEAHFLRSFRKRYGMTPKEYRRSRLLYRSARERKE